MQTAVVSHQANGQVDPTRPLNLGARCRETCPPGSEGGKCREASTYPTKLIAFTPYSQIIRSKLDHRVVLDGYNWHSCWPIGTSADDVVRDHANPLNCT